MLLEDAARAVEIGNGGTLRTIDITGNAVIEFFNAPRSTIRVKTGGTLASLSSDLRSEVIYLRAGSDDVRITIEKGAVVEGAAGEVILSTNAATGALLDNAGTIRRSSAGGDRLIHLFEASVLNRAGGLMHNNAADDAVVELENGGTLTNFGTIQNLGSGLAFEGDLTDTVTEAAAIGQNLAVVEFGVRAELQEAGHIFLRLQGRRSEDTTEHLGSFGLSFTF